MRRRLLIAVLWLWGSSALGADFYVGQDAYQRGDYRAALAEWQPLAEAGHTEAQYRLGRMLASADPVLDEAAAVQWYSQAAEADHARAQNNLALMYEQGRGTGQDLAKAVLWYRAAAEQGLAVAQANLARMYEQGRGVVANPSAAVRWYTASALSRHAESRYRLGLIYRDGLGVLADRAEARKWLKKAARQGHEEAAAALRSLGGKENVNKNATDEPARVAEPSDAPSGSAEELYEEAKRHLAGDGQRPNLDRAFELLAAGATMGHGPSAYRLAFLYHRGQAPEGRDAVTAHVWFTIAAELGVGDAASWRDRTGSRLSRREREQVTARLAELRRRD